MTRVNAYSFKVDVIVTISSVTEMNVTSMRTKRYYMRVRVVPLNASDTTIEATSSVHHAPAGTLLYKLISESLFLVRQLLRRALLQVEWSTSRICLSSRDVAS